MKLIMILLVFICGWFTANCAKEGDFILASCGVGLISGLLKAMTMFYYYM